MMLKPWREVAVPHGDVLKGALSAPGKAEESERVR